MTLHDAFGAKRNLDLAAFALDMSGDPISGSGIKRRSQHQKLAVAEGRQQRIDAVADHVAHGIEKFVDRRSDVTITGPFREIPLGSLVKNKRSSESALASSGCAPASTKGTRPDFSAARASSLRSLTLTVKPFARTRAPEECRHGLRRRRRSNPRSAR